MKKAKRAKTLLTACLAVFTLVIICTISVDAHSEIPEVYYDSCTELPFVDGIDEVWYIFEGVNKQDFGAEGVVENFHLGNGAQIMLYYFEPEGQYVIEETVYSYTWKETGWEPEEDIKTAYADSMKKWNNVYFYTYDSNGTITKNRLIYIAEGTAQNHNLSIFPTSASSSAAFTAPVGEGSVIDNGDVPHKHYSQWSMWVDVNSYYENGSPDDENVNIYREWAGAHEVGHMLGLRDVSEYCGDHHAELLMGYAETINKEQSIPPSINITYKDIAGAAITRGFHTDDDHKWLYAGQQSDGTYKLICTICNGVKNVDSLSEYTYDIYGSCGSNHNLSSGNMMAVASYGTKDYYKCKYCRYVAPFANNVEQDYVVTAYKDETRHWCVNNVTGLTYMIEAAHSYLFTYRDNAKHIGSCVCGYSVTQAHWIKQSEIVNNKATCIDCGAIIDVRVGFGEAEILTITKVSVNGSYILPNGIAVIVDEDVEAYLNGTLVFYDPDDVPAMQ